MPAEIAWAMTTAIGVIPMAKDVAVGLIRREPGVDLIALLAMVGALALGEYLAGAVIALMLSSGVALEAFADGRAHRELSALLERAPVSVTRYEDGELVSRPIEAVAVGDLLFVKTGEVVPVDGLIADQRRVGRIGTERRVTARRTPRRRSGSFGRRQCRRWRRSSGDGDRGGEHLRRDRPVGA